MTKIICVDAGHGGSDPGACANGLRECDIALSVSKMVGAYMKAVGYDVVYTRAKDVDVYGEYASVADECQARCDISNNANADVFVSIHCNSFGETSALGTETLYHAGSENGQRLAQSIQDQIMGLKATLSRGIKDNPLYVTKHTDAVACLVELAFLSNPKDSLLLASPKWQDKFAAAIARGITDYFASAE